jgi:hypothetical protein
MIIFLAYSLSINFDVTIHDFFYFIYIFFGLAKDLNKIRVELPRPPKARVSPKK